jgi:hypothetical protein
MGAGIYSLMSNANETHSINGTQVGETLKGAVLNYVLSESISFGQVKSFSNGTSQQWYQELGNPFLPLTQSNYYV